MNRITVNSPTIEGIKVGDLYHNANDNDIYIVTSTKWGPALVNLQNGEMSPYPQENILQFIKEKKLVVLPRNSTITISTN